MTRLSLSDARTLATAAESTAESLGRRVTIAVVDDAGHPILVARMDDRWFQVDIATAKAYCATALRRDTLSFGERLDANPYWRTVPHLLAGHVAAGGGGVLIRRQGDVLGAIGVSGAADADDETIAQTAVATFLGSTRAGNS